MKFSDFLREQKEKHAVLAFGRMNPITSGHEKLVNKVKDIATKVGGSHIIVLSHTQDSRKNPLSAAQKVKHAKRAFPGTNFTASSKQAPTFFDHAEKLYNQGVMHLHMVGGSDRVDEYKNLLNKYNGTKKVLVSISNQFTSILLVNVIQMRKVQLVSLHLKCVNMLLAAIIKDLKKVLHLQCQMSMLNKCTMMFVKV
jgi:hypothetical protein